jgi:hypothetical protein
MIYLNDLNVIVQIYTRDYQFNYGPMDRDNKAVRRHCDNLYRS